MELLVTLLFIVAIAAIWFFIEYWWLLLIFAGIFVWTLIVVFIFKIIELRKIDNEVVSAELISREPIVERVSEKTGHTTSYGRHLSYHEHYRYKNVITGYTVKFKVIYKNNKARIITCNENSNIYNKLINK